MSIQDELEKLALTAEFEECIRGATELNDATCEKLFSMSCQHGLAASKLISYASNILFERRVVRDITNGHARHTENTPPKTKEEISEILNCSPDQIFETADFICDVKAGFIIDYDGAGEFVSGDGSEKMSVLVDERWLNEFRDEWPYVVWYNR